MQRFETATAKASVLTEALPYIQDFKGSVVLVKVGGSVMESEDNLESLMDDLAFMHAVGIKLVVVHGGGKAISKAIKESGHEPQFVGGLRVTDEATMEIVRRTLNNVVNPDIVRRLTPLECERLQGLPDGYTLIPHRGKPAEECPDTPRYKALGNGWAVNCARWICQRIQKHEQENTDGNE